MTVSKSGAVHVYSGGTSLGQGIETVLAQIAADALGVEPGVVFVTPGRHGRPAVRRRVLGLPVHRGGRQRGAPGRDRGPGAGCPAGRADPRVLLSEDLELRDGAVAVRGDPDPRTARVSLAEIARAAEPASHYLEPGEPAGLSARRRFEVSHMTYPYGAHAAVVEVDPGTGQVRVLRYLVAYEVGRAVNPMLVEGQLRGGVAQGIGGALFEEFSYDEAGQPQAITFIEYRMPTAAEVPPVDLLVRRTPRRRATRSA